MINLSLRQSEWDALNALLVSHHTIDVTVQLMTLEHEYVSDLSKRLLGGQVTIDADATEATRQCSIELLDPFHELQLDNDAPEDGSIYFTRMIKVIYSVISPDRSLRFDIPIFCGPLSKVNRNGVIVSCDALGKEKLASASVWKGRDFRKGMKKTAAIIEMLTEMTGEKKIDINSIKDRLPRKLSLDNKTTVWSLGVKIAGSIPRQLFYDGRGVARVRRLPQKTVYVFREKGALLTLPQAGFDAEDAINSVDVVGGKPKGAKKKIKYRLVAPRAHSLSPWNLGRWGVPRYLTEYIDDDSIRSTAEARRVAKSFLKNALVEAVEVAFDSLPIPYLEENDLCRVTSDTYSGAFRLKKMTIPLSANGVSSVGYLKRVSPSPRQIKLKNTSRRKKAKR